MILAIDVGGTRIKYALIDENLNLYQKGRVPSVNTNLADFVESLGQVYDRFKDQVNGVAFSMPGVINPKTGYFYTGGAFDRFLHNLDFKSILEKRMPVRLSFANDAKCAANAEIGFGVLKDVENAIVIVFGTAIGGGIVYNHKVVLGSHFSAGEISYIASQYDATGFENSWSDRNGSAGLLRIVQRILNTEQFYTGEEIFAMANEGNEKVIEALKEYCQEIAIRIYSLQCTFDPEVFAIGGGISEQPLLLKYIDEGFNAIEKDYGYLVVRPKLVKCQFGNDANLIGAYYNFKLNYKD